MTVAITRTGHTAAMWRRRAAGSAAASVARRLRALALVLDGRKREDAARAAGSPKRPRRLRLGGEPCAVGCAAATRTAWQAWAAGTVAAPRPGFRPGRRRRLRTGHAPDPMSGRTAWHAGAAWTSRRGPHTGPASPCASAARASRAKPLLCPGCTGSGSPACPRARAIPRRTRQCRRLSGPRKPPRRFRRVRSPCGRGTARGRAGREDAHRGLAPGRGPSRKRSAFRRVGQRAETA